MAWIIARGAAQSFLRSKVEYVLEMGPASPSPVLRPAVAELFGLARSSAGGLAVGICPGVGSTVVPSVAVGSCWCCTAWTVGRLLMCPPMWEGVPGLSFAFALSGPVVDSRLDRWLNCVVAVGLSLHLGGVGEGQTHNLLVLHHPGPCLSCLKRSLVTEGGLCCMGKTLPCVLYHTPFRLESAPGSRVRTCSPSRNCNHL